MMGSLNIHHPDKTFVKILPLCFILVGQFSLASFPVSFVSCRITHSLTCCVSTRLNKLFSCSLNIVFCLWTFAHVDPLGSGVSNPGIQISTGPTTDQPHQKLPAWVMLPSVSIWLTPPPSSRLPSRTIPLSTKPSPISWAWLEVFPPTLPRHLIHISIVLCPGAILHQTVNSSRNIMALSSVSPGTCTGYLVISKYLSKEREGQKGKELEAIRVPNPGGLWMWGAPSASPVSVWHKAASTAWMQWVFKQPGGGQRE